MSPLHYLVPVLVLCPLAALAQSTPELLSTKQKASYIIGLQYGQQIQSRTGELDRGALLLGIQHAVSDTQPIVAMEKMASIMAAFQEEMAGEKAKAAEENMAAADKFLAQNQSRSEVTTTDSGLQYEVLESGDGTSPTTADTVVVHYRGRLLNGEEFDSSYSRGEPATFTLGQVIPGWQEALALMKPGAHWRVFIPPQLAYRERGAGSAIGPNEALVFDIELIEVK